MDAARLTAMLLLTAAATAAAPALAGSPPKPPRTRIYSTRPQDAYPAAPLHAVEVLMRINPELTVHAGHFNFADPNNTTLYSGLDVACAKPGGRAVFTNLGMPRQRFVLRNGAYRISSTFTRRNVLLLPDRTRNAYKVTLTAIVQRGKITGTVAVTGRGCTMPATRYTALLLPSGVG